MIDSIHQSTLSMALRCGEQFRRRYIMNEIIPPSIAAARGTGLHRANEVNLKQKVYSKVDLPVSDLLDAARDTFFEKLKDGVFLPKDEQDEKKSLINHGLNQTLNLTDLYHEKVAPDIQPIEVERPFRIDIGLELPLAGQIDHEQSGRVDDLKTSTRTWVADRIKHEIQPVFYSLAHEMEFKKRPEFRYHILIALKTQTRHQIQARTCTRDDYNALTARIVMFIKMLRSGVFLPAEIGSWYCSEKWCGYWTTCKYVGNAPAARWI